MYGEERARRAHTHRVIDEGDCMGMDIITTYVNYESSECDDDGA